MLKKNYREMTDAEIKAELRRICKESSSEDEIRQALQDQLCYPYGTAAITTHLPTDAAGREAQAIVQGLGGPLMKNGAMVMMMIYGPRGNILTL